MKAFHHLLANNLIANITNFTNFTVWLALTFWVYLETRSVFAAGMIAGIYLVFTAAFGFWFGSIVDHNSKKWDMLGSSIASAGFYRRDKANGLAGKCVNGPSAMSIFRSCACVLRRRCAGESGNHGRS